MVRSGVKKIGIMGGTFDPIHLGHINLAMDAKKQVGLDKVILVPAKLQPFKLDRKTASAEDRLNMIECAIEDVEGLDVSSLELDSQSISYTYLTIRAMRDIYGEKAGLYFITGTDSFLKIESWKNSEELLRGCSYIIGTRPGYKQKELESCIERIRRDYNTEVRNIKNTQLDISSTEIRKRLKNGKQCRELIPYEVEKYIKANGLYKE